MASTGAERRAFPSPFDVSIPAACAGWEEMYAQHALVSEERRDFEEGRFWFQGAVHASEPFYPFDAIVLDYIVVACNQASSRLFVVPPSLGLEYRIVNGYYYASATRSPTRSRSVSARSCSCGGAATTTSTGMSSTLAG